MRLSHLLAIPLLTMALFISVAPVALAAAKTAAPMCFCYVGGTSDKAGANKETSATDAEKCQAKCVENPDYEGYLWAENFSSYPNANLRCWQKQSDCEKDLDGALTYKPGSTTGETTVDGVWSRSQPAECLPGAHYCYSADTSPTYLNVSIAGKESVINFAEYIGVVYNYLMGFGMTVAIVFLMVGGLRYVTAGGSVMGSDDKETISGAKKMMKNAVEGFVILMFVYVILYTVNPQLLKLQVPKLPMLRQVIIGGNDCATLLGLEPTDSGDTIARNWDYVTDTSDYGDNAQISSENGVVLKFESSKDAKNPVCGVIAEIMTGPEQAPTVEGMTCQFNYCAPGKGGCATLPTGNKCILCEEVKPKNAMGAVPSASLCASLDPGERPVTNTIGDTYGTYNMCGYSHEPVLMVGEAKGTAILAAVGAAGILTIEAGGWGALLPLVPAFTIYVPDIITGACASLKIANCDTIKKCEDYDDLDVIGAGNNVNLDNLVFPTVGGNPNIYDICADNPCGDEPRSGRCAVDMTTTLATNCLPMEKIIVNNEIAASLANAQAVCASDDRSWYSLGGASQACQDAGKEYRRLINLKSINYHCPETPGCSW